MGQIQQTCDAALTLDLQFVQDLLVEPLVFLAYRARQLEPVNEKCGPHLTVDIPREVWDVKSVEARGLFVRGYDVPIGEGRLSMVWRYKLNSVDNVETMIGSPMWAMIEKFLQEVRWHTVRHPQNVFAHLMTSHGNSSI